MRGKYLMFGKGVSSEHMPSFKLTDEDFDENGSIDIVSVLVKSGLVPSRAEGRRAVEQGGVSVNGEKVADIKTSYAKDAFTEEFILKRGKKNFIKIEL